MSRDQSEEDRLARRLLEAASGGEPAGVPPYFMARLKRSVDRSAREASIGIMAWRMAPALMVVAACLAGWTAYQHRQFQKERDAAIERMVRGEGSPVDVAAAELFLSDGGLQ